MIYREQIEWNDTWVESAGQTQLPRVLLIGDSITRSYFPFVKEALKDKYSCARFATSKCVCDPFYELELELLFKQYEFSVIHFNNGLHGWDYDEEVYSKGLSRTLDFIVKNKYAENKLIIANSTPIWKSVKNKILDSKTDRVRERNRIVRNLSTQHGILLNDVFETVIKHPECFSDDGIHFIKEGQSIIGNAVAKVILELK